MKSNIPKNCRECDFDRTCTNPAPYGHYQCRYKTEIQKAATEAILHPNKEVNQHAHQ